MVNYSGMLDRAEIEQKATEFGIHAANVQRDYVFGWLLAGIYSVSNLGGDLILKGGNCFRKAYFPLTRFSNDLDFSTVSNISVERLREEIGKICQYIEAEAGVHFHSDKLRVEQQMEIDSRRTVYGVRAYFDDFYGKPNEFGISVDMDVTEFDRIYLTPQVRFLIHPYSDAEKCRVELRCLKLEELLAGKLKCLLQRRHIADLYDLAHSVIINRDVEVNRVEVLSTFLRKTIFEPAPGVAKALLLDLPLQTLREAWGKYIVCPTRSLIEWDGAIEAFRAFIENLFGPATPGWAAVVYFASPARNMIMDAGVGRRLLKVRYHGFDRMVEPYSLVFKRRQDGVGREYFYAYDRTGGHSGPGIKAFVHSDIEAMEPTTETYEPRYQIELGKAGEYSSKTYFGSPFPRSVVGRARSRSRRSQPHSRWRYVVECNYCGKQFIRSKHNLSLKEHKDGYGNRCLGRTANLIDRRFQQ
jgi:predicted nucleotidyltransferase component of viral defense system